VYRVGVTGGIGSGKTLVCNVFERLGIPVYYADARARRIMDTDGGLKEQITGIFSAEAYRQGVLDRRYVAEKAFGDPELLGKLNAVVHPVVRNDFNRWAEQQEDVPYVIEEAAILFESGGQGCLDSVVLVFAPENLRIERVMKRDDLDEGDVRRRMQHQMDDSAKIRMADHVIWNDHSRLLLPQIVQVHQQILNKRNR